MNKIIICFCILAICSFSASAQKLGYYREVSGNINYINQKATGDEINMKLSGWTVDFRGGYSLLGSLFFQDTERKFFIGDHLGAGFGVGYINGFADDIKYALELSIEYGLKAAYSVDDDLEVGVKLLYHGNYFTNMGDGLGFGSKPAIMPSVRFKNIMGTVGFGKGLISTDGRQSDGSFFRAEGRLIFGDAGDGDTHTAIFLRAESITGKEHEEFKKQTATQISFGFCIM
ncbi:MAG TPA: hypothetical protein VD927_19175 [Chryseosolibacter sp.]|nr:hypothetical protein [Chryseosolibacter sp.]